MSDVTLSYKGDDILELSDSGSATLKTGGKYCEADIEVEYVKPSGGGIRKVTGTFSILADPSNYQAPPTNCPTITHNLGTQKIVAIIYPVSIDANAGYEIFYLEYINVPLLIDSGTWELDFSRYNSNASTIQEVDPTNSGTRLSCGTTHQSPWSSQTYWYNATNQTAVVPNHVNLTDNTFRYNKVNFPKGTYKYVIIALE